MGRRERRSGKCPEGCIYRGNLGDGKTRICEYILITGHKRPCPGGRGCGVYENAKRGRKTKREARA